VSIGKCLICCIPGLWDCRQCLFGSTLLGGPVTPWPFKPWTMASSLFNSASSTDWWCKWWWCGGWGEDLFMQEQPSCLNPMKSSWQC